MGGQAELRVTAAQSVLLEGQQVCHRARGLAWERQPLFRSREIVDCQDALVLVMPPERGNMVILGINPPKIAPAKGSVPLARLNHVADRMPER